MTNQFPNIGVATQIREEEVIALGNITHLHNKYSVINSTEDSFNNSIEEIKLDKALELGNSSLFDVHRWSEYSQVNHAIDTLYTELKSVDGFGINSSIRKKHLIVVVLDLYVKWLTDPQMYSSYYRADWYYQDLESRYNKLFISRITMKVVDALESLGYLISIKGHYARNGGSSHIARMRATSKLINLITVGFKITPEMIEIAPDTECIVMRDWDEEKKRQVNISYEDNAYFEITRWRAELTAYNNLLRATYIDIPSFPLGGLVTKQTKIKYTKTDKLLKPHKIHINHHEKFIRRIFSNSDWQQGGRFYGGWWQRVPSEWRNRIRIGNMPVSEIDYKGLHIVILYLMLGLEYREDPYLLEGFEVSERMRNLLKQILLCSINARDKNAAIKSIRKEINFNPNDYDWVKELNLILENVIDAFVAKHHPIKKYFFSNSGVRLQNIDSKIAEVVICHFTRLGIPVLCVHDSFLVSADRAEELLKVMIQSFLAVSRELELPINKDPRTTQTGLGVGQWLVIQSHSDWREVRDGYIREPYDYPEWHKNLTEFHKREFIDYYHV